MPRWFLLLLVTCALQLPGTALLPLMDRDEPRFAGATVEMMERQTWTVPYFNDSYRFDKPPLTYWWMRLHYHLFGITELSARLHSVVATWLVSLIIFNIGQRLSGTRTAWLSALIWLTSLQVLIHGRLCVADMPMILGVTLAMRALMPLLGLMPEASPSKGRHQALLYGALAFGFLAKGPISLLAPLLTLALYRWWSRQKLPWRDLRLGRGLLLTLALVAAWGIPALIETQGLFWQVGMGEHVVRRGAEMLNGRPFIPGYYLITFFLSFFPWSGFTGPIIQQIRQDRSPPMLFLLAWFAAPLILFSFYATQLPHYILPGFPAAALLAGIALSRWHSQASEHRPKLLLALVLVFGGLAVAIAVLSFRLESQAIRHLTQLSAWLLASLAIVGVISHRALRQALSKRAATAWVGVGCLLMALPTHFFCDALRTNSATLAVMGGFPQGRPALHLGWDYTEPSLVFYSRSKWAFTGKAERAHQHLKRHPDAVVTALQREWTLDHWLRQQGSPQAKTDHVALLEEFMVRYPERRTLVVEGFNAARFSWVEILVILPPASASAAQPNPLGPQIPAPAR
jgi:4-amino-4-deoxy-L-arabinose transferase-like glycosyltransferase